MIATHRTRQRGFTLIELAVVIAIVGVIAALLISVSSRTYGANATNISSQLATTLNYARTRAFSTRKIHVVELRFGTVGVDPVEVDVWAAATAGMARTNYTTGTPGFVQRMRIPKGITVYGAVAGARAADPDPAFVPAQGPPSGTTYEIYFLPDGSATSSTIYVTDNSMIRKYRVLVYHATGSSYARTSW